MRERITKSCGRAERLVKRSPHHKDTIHVIAFSDLTTNSPVAEGERHTFADTSKPSITYITQFVHNNTSYYVQPNYLVVTL